jgi:hypothetical protein
MSRGPSSHDPRRDLVDKYPRGEDPFRPQGYTSTSGGIPPASINDPGRSMLTTPDIFRAWRVRPRTRPFVYQHELTFGLTVPDVNGNPVPIMPSPFQADAFIIDVASTAANSVFYAANNAVTTATGLEIRAGLPQFFGADNTRELWELQTRLEDIAGLLSTMLAVMTGGAQLEPPEPLIPPRVVFNMADRYLTAAASTVVSVTLFLVPEQQ